MLWRHLATKTTTKNSSLWQQKSVKLNNAPFMCKLSPSVSRIKISPGMISTEAMKCQDETTPQMAIRQSGSAGTHRNLSSRARILPLAQTNRRQPTNSKPNQQWSTNSNQPWSTNIDQHQPTPTNQPIAMLQCSFVFPSLRLPTPWVQEKNGLGSETSRARRGKVNHWLAIHHQCWLSNHGQ